MRLTILLGFGPPAQINLKEMEKMLFFTRRRHANCQDGKKRISSEFLLRLSPSLVTLMQP
ncbi:MAG: hypothetical protein Udaeo2_30120 [Candidatus Udaeobacter sp.]|nr:MAG: hypothetical protein Udaeo2_30120 [Candidatus Udaeobacter sp.]